MSTRRRSVKLLMTALLALALLPASGWMNARADCPCSIWPGPVTPGFAYDNPNPIEMGLKFRSDVAGYVTGVRFYKAVGATGTHIGRLWTMGGAKLAEVTFTNETASGWQSATFPTAVAIQADTTYIISYYLPDGNKKFSDTFDFFATTGVDAPPLHALAAGVDGPNGVYSDTGGFFNQTSRSSNYWVDLTFDTTPPPPDTIPPTITSRSPAIGAAGVLATTNVTVGFSEAMDPATLAGGAIELRDPSDNPVSASVSYDAGSYAAVLDPAANLAYNTTYTVRVVGGPAGVKDVAGNPLEADDTWSFTTEAPDTTPPTVVSVMPINGVSRLRLSTRATARFSEAMSAGTIDTDSFELRDAGGTLVAATVDYDAGTNSATLTSTSDLSRATTFTATVKGGAGGVEDVYGNVMAADFAWSFGTVAQRPPVDQAPGGPILIIASSANLFTRYFTEILRTEGLNEFAIADISEVTSQMLATYDVAILGDTALTAEQVTTLSDWVTGGGHLIAMRPDKQLAMLLGLIDAASTLSNGYVLIDTSQSPGTGITGQTLQFHGTADAYALDGATSLATLYSAIATPTAYPAVTIRSVGANGGSAAAFAFDLARSVVYTHQGNPAWQIGHVNPYQGYGTALDLFAPDWIDFNRITIPQADEQQRFLVNLILHMNADKKPLPRFWYFPNGTKAAIILTGDDHWGRSSPSGNSMVFFERHKAQSPVGCSVVDWECVRSSSYGYDGNLMTDAQAAAYTAEGFEFGLHADAGLASGGGWCGTWPSDMPAKYSAQFEALMTKYASIPVQGSERSHCYSWFGYTGAPGWQGYTGTPEVEANLDIRLDTNISYNPAGWATTNPGYQMGSGMLMRFAKVDNDGVMTAFLDIHNGGTQMNDDNGQGATAMRSIVDAFLDRANGPEGYYGAFVVNMHSDNWYGWSYAGSDEIVASAQAHGVPVVSGTQMVDWLNGRNSSSFDSITWDGTTLGFSIVAGAGARNLQAMVPASVGVIPLSDLTRDGNPVPYTRRTIKGVDYYFFPATTGAYVATYAPDTTPPTISDVSAEPTGGQSASITWSTNEAATSHVDYGIAPDALTSSAGDGSLVSQHAIDLTGLLPHTTYYYLVSSTDESGNTSSAPPQPGSFTTPAASFIDTTVTDFGLGSPDANAYVSQMADGEVILKPAVGAEFSGSTLPPGWSATAGTATVGGGVLVVNGSAVGPAGTYYAAGRSVEAVATFTPGPFQHLGFGVNYTAVSGDAWAIISTGATGTGLLARCWTGSGGFDTQSTAIPGSYLGAPHRYRVDWNAGSIDYWVDGVKLVTHNVAISTPMRPLVADGTSDASSLSIDWLRMTPYPTAGTFTSRVLDTQGVVTGGGITWTEERPAVTSLVMSVRSGNSPTPDGDWSPFTVVTNGEPIGNGFRYIQYRAEPATTDPNETPVLRDVSILYDFGPCPEETCNGLDDDCDGSVDEGGDALCADADACTSDTCQGPAGCSNTAVVCTPLDQCHEAGTCDPGTGLCTEPPKTDGTECDDGSACTQSDSCQSGVCTGASVVTCTASDPCHDVGVCDPATGTCSNPAAPDGTACSDGTACTQTDTCQSGVCTGANPVICTPSDPCHLAGTCDPATGTCSSPAAPDGTACSDANACTQTDTCQSGSCTGANPVTCTAADQCHDPGTCDPATGCSNPPKADGTACDDGVECTQPDQCQAGSCIGAHAAECGAAWYDRNWSYRRDVHVASPCGQDVTGYPVLVALDSAFDFTRALADGSDLRVTAGDGTTLLPYWIESWDPGAMQATLWVKAPLIPAAGATIYLYYGNPSPSGAPTVESPPIGPWTRAAGNPIRPIGDSGNGNSLLAENIVYDSVTGHYWMVFANYRDGSVGLIWSDDPANPAAWHWQGTVIGSANAPHILSFNGTWYIFYADRAHGGPPYPISVATSSSVAGPYTFSNVALTSSYGWEVYRVDEPYVFRRNDGKWVLMYMGDSGGAHEQVSYATADDILGPYTKYGPDPAIPFGVAGSFDAGTVADPWVVEYHGVYYIGYTVSPTTSSPWQTAYATTTDWQTFTKHGITLPLAASGWDATNAFRGAVTRVGDTWVFPYTGDAYQMGIATQPVFTTLTLNDPATVFSFFDAFNGTSLDTTKWAFDMGTTSQATVSGGSLTLTATATYVKIRGQSTFGMDFLVESRARHPQAGTNQLISEIGWTGAAFADSVRMADDFHNTTYWERQVRRTGTPGDPWVNMAQPVDTGWHLFRIFRLSPATAGFQIDDTPAETVTAEVPTGSLPPFLMSYGSTNQFVVDWIRVRKWCGSDAACTVGFEQSRPLVASISISKGSAAQVVSGADASFSITVTNTGDFALSGVAVADLLAPDCDRQLGELAAQAAQTYGCVLPGVTADFTNTATVTATTPSSGTVSAAASTFVDVIHPAISIALTPATQDVIEGYAATFTVTVSNTGDVALQNVAVTDAVVPDCGRTLGSLPAGQGTSYTCSQSNVSAPFSHTASVTGDAPLGAFASASADSSVTVRSLAGAAWMDTAWLFRSAVVVSNPCGEDATGYQVRFVLDGGFDFAKANADGSDLRVTAIDGVTAVPFWIESWDASAGQAAIWVRVPQLPISGTAVFLYYGNPSPPGPPQLEMPPIGPWTRAAGNPIAPMGGPVGSLLAENIVYDDETGHYWMVHANYNDGGVGLVWSDTPADPASWHWHGTVVAQANAPHLVHHNGTWYIFYSDWSGDYNSPHSLFVSTASSVTGPYAYTATVLSPSEPWEAWRVDEPFVFQRNDGKWILVYMADQARAVEQVGYAIADDILGPYTKFAGNPALAFGPPGSYDAGTIADPWVVEFHGVYYIGYTVSPTTSSPWQTAYATTTDWQTFTKHGVTLALGPPGAWDAANTFRGAVTRVGDTYVFSYTGDSYQMGIATQPVFMAQPQNDPAQVFELYDAFDGSEVDGGKWGFRRESASNGTATVAGGILTLTATGTGVHDLIELVGNRTFGTGVLLEAMARHPDASGTTATAAELGFGDANRTNLIRIMDYDQPTFLKNTASGGGSANLVPMAHALDTQNYLLHRIHRASNGQARFALADDPWETIAVNVPTSALPAWLMAYSDPTPTRLQVDWLRVRNWCGADAPTELRAEQGEGCVPGAPGTPCDDGDACTLTDACNATGQCIGSNPMSCDDGDACTTDACSDGQCLHLAGCGVLGAVHYYRNNGGAGSEPSTKAVPNVGIGPSATGPLLATTDAGGAYLIGDLHGDVTVTPLNKFGAQRAADHNGAISSFDAAQVAMAAVGNGSLTANQTLAGDVTANGTISALDASQIARFAVQLVDHFPVATATGSDWKFLKCDTNPLACGNPVYTFAPLVQTETAVDFYAILYGDVSGDWASTGGLAASRATTVPDEHRASGRDRELADRFRRDGAPPVIERDPRMPAAELSLGGWKPLRAGERRELTVDLRNADGILGLDLVLTYDRSRIAIVDVRATGIGSSLSVARADRTGTQWIAAYGFAGLSGSGSILTITVEGLKNTGRQVPPAIDGVANEGGIALAVKGRDQAQRTEK